LAREAEHLAHLLGKVKGVVHASAESSGRRRPVHAIEFRRQEAQALGVRRADVLQTLQAGCGNFYVDDFNRFGRNWQVRPQSDTRLFPEDIKRLRVRNQRGEMVPLGAVCAIREEAAETVIYRVDGQECVVVSCNVRAAARKDVDRSLRQLLKETLPKGISPHIEK
jgi:multidrug efflux pump subunit AcrB